MSVSLLKSLIWLAALGLTGYIGWSFYGTISTWSAETAELTKKRQLEILDRPPSPEPPRVDLVDYELVKSAFIGMDWTGRPPPEPILPPVVDDGPKATPQIPVASLLRVFYLHQDGRYPEQSFALIEYIDTQLNRAAREKDPPANAEGDKVRLVPGEHLPAPHDGVEVLQILASGIVFGFADGREPEIVQVLQLSNPSGIVLVPPGESALSPSSVSLIPRAEDPVPFVPNRTTKIGDNTYRLGTEDIDRFEENYTQIITEEARHRRWRDPSTGQYAGIELAHVEPGGILAAHGAQSGDVIKSINGHPVSSVPEAITYVKNNAETTTVWEVIVVNKGIETKMIFESPPEP